MKLAWFWLRREWREFLNRHTSCPANGPIRALFSAWRAGRARPAPATQRLPAQPASGVVVLAALPAVMAAAPAGLAALPAVAGQLAVALAVAPAWARARSGGGARLDASKPALPVVQLLAEH